MQAISEQGITLVEVLIGAAVVLLLAVVVGQTVLLFTKSAATTVEHTKATLLAQEGHELVRLIRDNDWTSLTDEPSDTVLYLASGTPAFTPTIEIIDGYTRTVRLYDVYRDNDDDIVASTTSGATVDADGRFVEVFVTWPGGKVRTRSLLTNIFDRS